MNQPNPEEFQPAAFDPAEFSGRVRMFPLPNLVVFPHGLQLLHVFEPRYRALVDATLATDRLIAMMVLAAGWEGDYEGRPPVQPVGCLGWISTHHRFPDGRYNLLLQGLHRVRVVEELPPAELFRQARVELCVNAADVGPECGSLRSELHEAFLHSLPHGAELQGTLSPLREDLSLSSLTDIVAFALDLGLETKGQLLAEFDARRRARLLLQRLRERRGGAPGERTASGNRFPPRFSEN